MGILAHFYRKLNSPLQPYSDYQASGLAFKIAMSLFLAGLVLLILGAILGAVDASSFISGLVCIGIYQFINYKVSKKILMK